MVQSTGQPEIVFNGTKAVQEAASRAFSVMRARGMFASDTAPITVKKDELVAFLKESDITERSLAKALEENDAVFLQTTDADGNEIVMTTRAGRIPGVVTKDDHHTFAQRLMTPEPKPAKPVMPKRERVRVQPSWATFQVPDFEEEELEPGAISDDTMIGAPSEPSTEPVIPDILSADVIAEIIKPSEMAEMIPASTTTPAEETTTEVEQETEAAEEPVEVAAEAVVEVPVEQAEEAPAEEAPARRVVDELIVPEEVQRQVRPHVQRESRTLTFGNQEMPEDRVQRLSRNELRRIREYIDEQEQPLEDAALVEDILGVRAGSPNYDAALFSLNYRLSKEREFEFVGTNDQRFWATNSLPSIGTTLRKPADIGTDYRFLVEHEEEVAPRSATAVDHVVTFYEYVHGLLPFDNEIRQLFNPPLLDDQRTAVFTFEIPQTFTTYLVELRYPAGNRGGFLLGLDDFYADSLVPGAIISISATENDGHFKVEYLATADQSDRLLELDERRSPRYHFRPTTFACEVDASWLINEDRFPQLGSEKPLADKVRRNTGNVLAATFDRVGMDDGNGGKLAAFEDLLAAVNIERPMPADLLRDALASDSHVSGDEGSGFTYVSA